MKFVKALKLSELAKAINANLIGGNGSEVISALNTIQDGQQQQVAFLANPLYAKYLPETKCSAVVLAEKYLPKCTVAALVVENPRLALTKLIKLCVPEEKIIPGIHKSVVIGENCNISSKALIKANCVIGNNVTIEDNTVIEAGVVVGDNCYLHHNVTLYPNVTLYAKVSIGANTIIHANTVLGSDGFGYANDNGNWVKTLHVGGVKIGDNVEIGSNTSIDKGFLEDTVIEDGVIIDNLVQIGHNVVIGSKTAIAGCVAIAGSTKIGKRCLIGGTAAIAGHLEIADNVIITAGSGLNRSIEKPGIYSSGMPAKANALWRKNVARFYQLDAMAKRLRELEKTVQANMESIKVST